MNLLAIDPDVSIFLGVKNFSAFLAIGVLPVV
jgi:hypothetical protein